MLPISLKSIASNIGKFNDACIHLESLLNHSLLWTACRHHMHEVILSPVFKNIFVKSSRPQIIFFEILKKKWSTLNFAVDMTHIADFETLEDAFKALHEIRYDSNSYIPRNDCAELLDILYYLNKNSFTFIGFDALVSNIEHAGCLQLYMHLRCCCFKLNLMWMQNFSRFRTVWLFCCRR